MTADQYVELTDLATNAERVSARLHSEAKQWDTRHAAHESEAMAQASAEVARGLRWVAAAVEVYTHAVRAEQGKVRL